MLSFARSLYAFQDFRIYGMRGGLFLEDYRSRIRGTEAYHPTGVEIYNFVVVYFNDKGETSQLVMNHRPQSATLLFSSLLTRHFGDAFDRSLFYDGDVSAPSARPRPVPRKVGSVADAQHLASAICTRLAGGEPKAQRPACSPSSASLSTTAVSWGSIAARRDTEPGHTTRRDECAWLQSRGAGPSETPPAIRSGGVPVRSPSDGGGDDRGRGQRPHRRAYRPPPSRS